MRHSDEIVFIGLSITSSWRNDHAFTYRSLIRGLCRQGRRVLFLEQDRPCFASNRDPSILPDCQSRLYADVDELRSRFTPRIRAAAAVVVGSSVHDGRRVCDWVLGSADGVKVFYDMDAASTVTALADDRCNHLSLAQLSRFDLVLSRAGGSQLRCLEHELGARCVRPLYSCIDLDGCGEAPGRRDIDLGYLGDYAADLQHALESLLIESGRRLPKRRFTVVGARYPAHLSWPRNIHHVDHITPDAHAAFYARQRFTLDLAGVDASSAGRSPSVRFLEAVACGTVLISDGGARPFEVLKPGTEMLIAHSADDVTSYLQELSDAQVQQIATAAYQRVCAEHSSLRRANELETYLSAARESERTPPKRDHVEQMFV